MKLSPESERKLRVLYETHEERIANLKKVTDKMKASNAKLRAYLKLPEPTK